MLYSILTSLISESPDLSFRKMGNCHNPTKAKGEAKYGSPGWLTRLTWLTWLVHLAHLVQLAGSPDWLSWFTWLAHPAQADAEWQVTAAMVRGALKLKCKDRVVLNALHSRGIRFHPMREKPIRTADDEKDRKKFGHAHSKKPVGFWETDVHAYLDNKFFPHYPNAAARSYAAKRAARGTMRAKGQGLAKGHVKPRKGLQVSFGRSVCMSVAISSKTVLICHETKGNWNGAAACDMYSNALAPALR
jgi:hypothetical protein